MFHDFCLTRGWEGNCQSLAGGILFFLPAVLFASKVKGVCCIERIEHLMNFCHVSYGNFYVQSQFCNSIL